MIRRELIWACGVVCAGPTETRASGPILRDDRMEDCWMWGASTSASERCCTSASIRFETKGSELWKDVCWISVHPNRDVAEQ